MTTGTKVIEVDPREDAPVFQRIGERPAHIAAGVLMAIQDWARRSRARGPA